MASQQKSTDTKKQSATSRSPQSEAQNLEHLNQQTSAAAVIQRAFSTSQPPPPNPGDLLSLQRTVGNRAANRLLDQRRGAAPIQATLTVGPADDPYEQEADRVAAQVVGQVGSPASGPGRGVQRQDNPEDDDLKRTPLTDSIQRGATAADGLEVSSEVETSIQSARGGGQPLSTAMRTSMEGAFGADFSGVRVHTGSQADTLNRSVQARAFTTGPDIFFGADQYQPGSSEGQKLIAHELTHVVQQQGGQLQRARPLSTAAPVPEARPGTGADTATPLPRGGAPSHWMGHPIPVSASSAGASIQRVYNNEQYTSNGQARQIYVDPQDVTWGGADPQNRPGRDNQRAIMFETISTPPRIGGLIDTYDQRTNDAMWDVGLSVVLNSFYVPLQNNVDDTQGNSLHRAQAVPQNKRLNSVQTALDAARDALVQDWQGPPIAVSTATWEQHYVEANGETRLPTPKPYVPYARLRKLSAMNAGAVQIRQALEARQNATTWRKMGDDDMPIPNPNDVNDRQMERLQETEPNTDGLTTFVTFGYNLTTGGTGPLMTEILERVYANEMALRQQLTQLGAMTYPIEPNTFYKFSSEQESTQAWNGMEGQNVGGGGGQIKEGLKLLSSAQQGYVSQQTFHTTKINTDSGGRNQALIDLIQPYLTSAEQQGVRLEPALTADQVEGVLNDMDQSYFQPGVWSAVATQLMDPQALGNILTLGDALVVRIRRATATEIALVVTNGCARVIQENRRRKRVEM